MAICEDLPVSLAFELVANREGLSRDYTCESRESEPLRELIRMTAAADQGGGGSMQKRATEQSGNGQPKQGPPDSEGLGRITSSELTPERREVEVACWC